MHGVCKALEAGSDAALKTACAQAGRLMLDRSASLLSAMFGASILRRAGVLAGAELERARALAWRGKNAAMLASGEATSRYLDELIATGNQIEAMRLAAARAGRTDAPAGWKPRYDVDAPAAAADR